MQISTNLLFERSSTQMNNVQNDLAKSQAQIAARKQVLNPSDAPDQAAAITRLKSVIARQDSYSATLDSVQTNLDNEDTILGNANDVLTRLKELAIQANSGTQSDTSRQAIAGEMKGLRNQLLSLANSQSTSGNFIFSGSRTRTQAFASQSDGSVVYQGDQSRTRGAVGEQLTITTNRPGTCAFVSVVRDNGSGATGVGFFQSIDDLVAGVWTKGVAAPDTAAIQRGITEMGSLQQGVVLARSESGSDSQVVQQQGTALDSTKLNLQTALSGIEDLDYASAITKMQQQMLSLQAAQNSFGKISQLSLFNYIK